MTFEEFKATAVASDNLAIVTDQVDLPDGVARVWHYAGTCFLAEMADGQFYLLLERDEFYGSRGDMESALYDWYKAECL